MLNNRNFKKNLVLIVSSVLVGLEAQQIYAHDLEKPRGVELKRNFSLNLDEY
jgi:hypothetical protein